MKFLRKEKVIDRGTIGPNESYEVEVEVHIYWNPHTQTEEQAFDAEAMAKIEAAIEAVHPGWYHTCDVGDPEKPCQACIRKRFQERI